MNQRHDYRRETRPPSTGRYTSRDREFEEGRYSRHGTPRPDERYGADDEYPDRSRQFDGSEYEWRGDQAGRGGQEDYWRGSEAGRQNNPGSERPNRQYTSGQFAGRGPKGYKRSDDRILEDLNEQLTQHPDIDASEIEVQVKDGEVILTGTVEERHCKRLAEDIAEGISGVQDVRNEIRLQRFTSGMNRSGDQSKSGANDRGSNGMTQSQRA